MVIFFKGNPIKHVIYEHVSNGMDIHTQFFTEPEQQKGIISAMLMCNFFSIKNNSNILNVDYLIISNVTVLLGRHPEYKFLWSFVI